MSDEIAVLKSNRSIFLVTAAMVGLSDLLGRAQRQAAPPDE